MFKTIRTQTRPDTSVSFFDAQTSPLITQEFKQYLWTTYMSTGKLISTTNDTSADGLVLTTTVLWDSEASLDQFNVDETIISNFKNIITDYCTVNNIIDETVIKEAI